VNRPAPVLRSVAALTAMELRLALRRGENLLVMAVIPVAVLLFFATTGTLPAIAGRPVDFLLPGSLALAIIATSLVNLGIATAYERSYGVLKRLGGSPLPRWGLVVSKLLAVAVIEVAQVALLLVVAAIVLGWTPAPATSPVLLIGGLALGLALGTLAFAGLGLLMAGRLRAEATLAGANGLFLLFLMLGGIVLPVDHLPAPLAMVAPLLPAAPLADVFRVALGGSAEVGPAVVVLAIWGVAASALAARTFRWE
jgi:ABC-2 type transport system permease protein